MLRRKRDKSKPVAALILDTGVLRKVVLAGMLLVSVSARVATASLVSTSSSSSASMSAQSLRPLAESVSGAQVEEFEEEVE
jgi:hypothetical protein